MGRVLALVSAGLLAFSIDAEAGASQLRGALDGVRAPASELQRASVVESGGVRFHRFRHVVGGLPVLGSEAVVTDAPGRGGDLVSDGTRRITRPAPLQLGRPAAIARALSHAGVRSLRIPPRASLAILASPPEARIVWRVLLASGDPFASFEVLVDARAGRVLRTRDLLQRATGSARLFDPNPVVTNGGTSGLSDAADGDSALLTALRRLRSLERLDSSTCLQGIWVEAFLPAGNPAASTPAGDVCSPTRNFDAVTRSDDRFEALMAYFHIDRAQAYVQGLGFGNVLNRRVTANVDAVLPGPPTESGQDNSFFDPLSGELTFGTGFADDAEDAETIVHEYGHALQDDQVPNFGLSDDAAAIGEGFADYFASSLSATFAPAAGFDACFDEWDGFASGLGPCLRRVDWGLRVGQTAPDCPDAADEHCRGEVWSGALWAIRSAVGGRTADRLVIQAQFSLTPNASFDQAARALLAADAALYGRAHRPVLALVLGSRGLVNVEHLDDTPADAAALTLPGRVAGTLSSEDDIHDVFRLNLASRRPVVLRLHSSSGDYDLRILGPGASSVDSPPVAFAETASGNEDIHYTPATTGIHYVDVRAVSGRGPYELEAASDDRDGDGRRDDRDVCPNRGDPLQRDWDTDGRGDACDPSARVSITGVRRIGIRLRVRARMLPASLPARAFRLTVWRQSCRARQRCSYRPFRELGARRSRSGRVELRVRMQPGRYRLRAALRARGYRKARSRPRVVLVRR